MKKLQTYSLTQNAKKYFIWMLVIHLVVWTLLPTIFFPTMQIDTSEAITWGRMWQWGYYIHPPLSAWFTYVASVIGSAHIDFAVYLLSQLFILATFLGVWRFANKLLSPMQSLLAVLLLEGIHFYSFESTQFDPNIAMLPFWIWFINFAYDAFKQDKLTSWFLAGVMAGLGFLAKYETFILLAPVILFVLFNRDARVVLKRSGFYLAMLVCVLIFLLNIIWVFKHNFLPITYAMNEANTDKLISHHAALQFMAIRFLHFGQYLLMQIGNMLPVFILLIPIYRWRRKDLGDASPFNSAYLWWVGLGPIWFTAILTLVFGVTVRGQWPLPYFSCLGIALIYFLRPDINNKAFKRFIALVVAIFVLIAAGTAIGVRVFPYIKHKPTEKQYPARPLANYITNRWHQLYHTKLPYVVAMRKLLSNIGAYSKDQPVPFIQFSLADSPWLTMADVHKKGIVVVWRADDATAAHLAKVMFPQKGVLEHKRFKYLTGAKVPPLDIYIKYVGPASS